MPRGGARAGAGRKSKASKLVDAGFACGFFDSLKQEKFWKSMLAPKMDPGVRLSAAKYLTDRLYGKSTQPMAHKNDGDKPFEVTIRSILGGGGGKKT